MTPAKTARDSGELSGMLLSDLRKTGERLGIEGAETMKKGDLVTAIGDLQAANREAAKAEKEAKRAERDSRRNRGRDNQEEDNVSFVVDHGLGLYCPERANLPSAVATIYEHYAEFVAAKPRNVEHGPERIAAHMLRSLRKSADGQQPLRMLS